MASISTSDSHHLPLSTSSEAAADHYREGVARMLSAWPGAAQSLDAAIAADPNFALAHAARARLHAIHGETAAMREAMLSATVLAGGKVTERERSHVDVLDVMLSGRSKEALGRALDHADRWPRDIIILSLPLGAFGLFAFSGMADHDQARVDLCEKRAAHFAADDWWFLTYRGWALAENREVARGRAMLERAHDLRRENANTVHALAHAMYEGGANDEGEALIEGWLPNYDRSGLLHGHIAWHAALIALERGDDAKALSIYAGQVRPGVSLGLPINVVSDGASLLWRLDAYGGGAPGDLWQEVATYARKAFPKSGHPFVDTHMGLIAAATGDAADLDGRLRALDAMVETGSLNAGPVVPTIFRAAEAFRNEDFAKCARLLTPYTAEVARIGGSGAQREVIEDTLVLALMRSGETERARELLDRRLHRRPSPRDALWRDQLAL